MFFEDITGKNGNMVKAKILPEVTINNRTRIASVFIAPFVGNNIVRDNGIPIILHKVFKKRFAISKNLKSIKIDNTKYDIPDYYNKDMLKKNDEKTVSMVILQLFYDEIWRSIADCANLKGLKSDMRAK